MGRIELPTSPLPRECSTPELHGLWGHSKLLGTALSKAFAIKLAKQKDQGFGRGPFAELGWWVVKGSNFRPTD